MWQVADTMAYTDTELQEHLAELIERESEAALDRYSVKLDYIAAQVLDIVAADVAGDGKEPGNYRSLTLREEGGEEEVQGLEHMQLWPGMNTGTQRWWEPGVEEVMWACQDGVGAVEVPKRELMVCCLLPIPTNHRHEKCGFHNLS